MAGWTKAWRKEVNSTIWDMPPIYHRTFHYLRQKVAYEVEFFPTRRRFGIWLRPGQMLTSMAALSAGVAWSEYGVEKRPNKKTIKTVLEWLEFKGAIILESNDFGTFIYLTKWGIYQGSEAAESNDSCPAEKRFLPTLKEVEEDKEVKPKRNTTRGKRFVKPTLEDVTAYCDERQNGIDPQRFIDHYEANGWRVGKNPMKDWRAAVRTWEKRQKEVEGGKIAGKAKGRDENTADDWVGDLPRFGAR